MRSDGYEYQSEFFRRFLQQGREEGREEGQQEGRLEGERSALFKVLEARGLEVGKAGRRRLLACTDLAQLERWVGLAVKVQSIQELFSSESAESPSGKARKPRSRQGRPRS